MGRGTTISLFRLLLFSTPRESNVESDRELLWHKDGVRC